MLEFDLKTLLDEHGIAYKTSGKNVSKGWINLEVCPFCNDSSYHCGVDLSSGGFHCWVCNEKGFVLSLLREMEIFQGLNLRRILSDFNEEHNFLQDGKENQNLALPSQKKRYICSLPQGTLDELPLPHRNYLVKRGFDPDFLIKKYKLKAVYNTGDPKFRFRIIAPIFIDNKMVSFVGASVIREEGIIKYLNCPTEDSVISAKDSLYNYDSIKNIAVIVEGITDVWRMGDGFVATLGKGMNSERIELLRQKNPKKVIVMYDADAVADSHRVAENLCGLFESVEVLELDKGDPADLSDAEAQELRAILWK